MNSSPDIRPARAAWIGALLLAGGALAPHAHAAVPPSFQTSDGVVAAVDFNAKSVTIHPVFGNDLTLTVTTTTKFNTDGVPNPNARPKGHTQAETRPDPASYIGLYVRAQYNPTTLAANTIWLRPPTPLPAEGVVHSASDTGLAVDLPDGHSLMLVIDTNTVCRLDGQPAAGHALAPGDPVSVAFLLKPTENLAVQVMARTPAPLTFGGLFVPAVQSQGSDTFGVRRGRQTMTFTVDDQTVFTIGDKPAKLADFQANQPVGVIYRADGSVFVAIKLIGQAPPKPETHGSGTPGANDPPKPGPTGGPAGHPTPGAGGDAGKTPPTQPDESHAAMEAALKALQQAKEYLQHAARDFNGHRAAAAAFTDKAISEVQAGLASDTK